MSSDDLDLLDLLEPDEFDEVSDGACGTTVAEAEVAGAGCGTGGSSLGARPVRAGGSVEVALDSVVGMGAGAGAGGRGWKAAGGEEKEEEW